MIRCLIEIKCYKNENCFIWKLNENIILKVVIKLCHLFCLTFFWSATPSHPSRHLLGFIWPYAGIDWTPNLVRFDQLFNFTQVATKMLPSFLFDFFLVSKPLPPLQAPVRLHLTICWNWLNPKLGQIWPTF